MAMRIVPHKVVITYAEDGTFSKAVLIYRKKDRDTGAMSEQYNTISVDSEVSVPAMNTLLRNFKQFARQQENAVD